MPEIPELLTMLKNGVHFGHRESKWHPKMAPFIFGARNGVHIINLEKTAEALKVALDAMKEVVAEGGMILFVGSKNQAGKIVEKHAKAVTMPYVHRRWLGGTLTNFSVIHSLVKKLQRLEQQEQELEYEKKYTKKERLMFGAEKERLEGMVGGVRIMERNPQMLFVLDIKHEKTAVAEARRESIPIVAVCDTNANPDLVTYPIPGNDDATKSIEFFTALAAAAVQEGLDEREVRRAEREKNAAKLKMTNDK